MRIDKTDINSIRRNESTVQRFKSRQIVNQELDKDEGIVNHKYGFAIATEPDQFEQIHRLNYRTFVEEIPQHQKNDERRLVDRFHDENTYVIATHKDVVIGMVAIRSSRPFSIDQKLPDVDAHLPSHQAKCELRLLVVEKSYRSSGVFLGLMEVVHKCVTEQGFDLALISGTTRQLALYNSLGFVPFSTLVGQENALFQPMYITPALFESARARFHFSLRSTPKQDQHQDVPESHVASTRSPVQNFLPGPVGLHQDVSRQLSETPISHRSDEFVQRVKRVKRQLYDLTNARHVELMMGAGTLANDAIAAQLTQLRGQGLVLTNGEFGDRLIDHASRMQLSFESIHSSWNGQLDLSTLENRLHENEEISWVWAVHCETSTGMLNDIESLQTLCDRYGVKLCLDCISSIGAVQTDLSRVYLASGVSGKAIGSYSGIAMVFYNHRMSSSPSIPRYLDVGYYADKGGVPFTINSNLLAALDAALSQDYRAKHVRIEVTSRLLRKRLAEAGIRTLVGLVGDDSVRSPAVLTIPVPQEMSSRKIGDELAGKGCLLSYESQYLLERNWIQICLMGQCNPVACDMLATEVIATLSQSNIDQGHTQ